MHTARWVVDECFSGPLLKGRTVILVTHNVALTSRLAENVVEIASDGTISQRASVAEALVGNPKLLEHAIDDTETIETDGEVIDPRERRNTAGKTSGKLIADEEIALRRVSMKASTSEAFVCPNHVDVNSLNSDVIFRKHGRGRFLGRILGSSSRC